jgi:hypothetical protein
MGMQVVEQWKCGIGFNGIVRLDPWKGFPPVIKLPHRFSGIIEQTAGLELVVGNDVVNLLGLRW